MARNSLGFSDFRSLLDRWDEHVSGEKIQTIIEDNGFVLFLKRGNSIYAATEDGRLTFARMKHPDPDDPKGYMKTATFTATDLTKALDGEKVETVFNINDIKLTKVISQEKAEKFLKQASEKVDVTKIKTKLARTKPTPDNMQKVDEK
jgi:hypothetical protein